MLSPVEVSDDTQLKKQVQKSSQLVGSANIPVDRRLSLVEKSNGGSSSAYSF